MSNFNLADPAEENEKQPRLIGSNPESPSRGRKNERRKKEVSHRKEAGHRNGTELRRMTIREDSWARARVYTKVGEPVSS